MSAERDNQQGMTFIYSNFYQLYRKAKIEKEAHAAAKALTGKVLKTAAITETPVPAEVRVINSQQTDAWAQWAKNKNVGQASKLHNVREHLKQLREAKSRLKFLSDELEEILKRS
ncbi:MAG: hypothetical protein JST80_05465 [Bdellovibrionales bacterium]|nr:hypothetical protein [Bdellovibrionales bacterium]